jgi:hypothetical protein
MDAIQRAAEGNVEAYNMILTNVRTDVVERTLKAGHITEVPLEVTGAGEMLQYGQTAADIQANSLRFAANSPQMRERTEAETRNMFRITEANRQGLLEDYNVVVLSRAADDMSESEMEEAGFFTDTMSCAIQVTSRTGDRMQVESAFVAGKKTWASPRSDETTIAKLGAELGVNLDGKTATELLDAPLLVHKSLMPNGALDIVELYDKAAGGTFFGQTKPPQDYAVYKRQCSARETSFEPRVQAIARQLILEAPRITTPRLASERLGKLSQKEMLEHSLHDTSIDARVFGTEAAFRIEHARYLYEQGNLAEATIVANAAQKVARSSSCPGGVNKANPNAEQLGGEPDDKSSKNEEVKDCDFISKECPKCHKKNVKTVVKKGKYYGACGCIG